MIALSPDRIQKIFNGFERQTILVIGDLMLDHYLWGDINRISPEAPVPVVDIQSEEYKLGGAANVCYNIKTLGATIIPVGVTGQDMNGERMNALFQKSGMNTDGLFSDPSRPTTIKSRIMARGQHVIRADQEVRTDLSAAMARQIIDFVKGHLNQINGIILEDYNKGLLTGELIRALVKMANEQQVPVSVDPKFEHFFDYEDVCLFKPNRKEVTDRLGLVDVDEKKLMEAGKILMERLRCDALLITLGAEGMALFEKGQYPASIPTKAVKVHDVSGAGDTVIATMAVCQASGANFKEAATIANQAAGLVCGQVGIVPVKKDALFQSLQAQM